MNEGYIAALRGLALAAGTEIVAASTDLTRQKVHETSLLDRSRIADDPRILPAIVRHSTASLVSSWAAEYIRAGGPGREHDDGGTR